jgi:hypothetical protein
MAKKNLISPPRFVALVTEKSTAKEPLFVNEILPAFKVSTTRSLWEAAKWDSKLEVNKALQNVRLVFLPHRVRISLTLE